MLMKGGFKRLHIYSRKLRNPAGFTIIEVMIVLGVTGLLLSGAILLISGRQNETEFQQAINSVKVQIQQAINDVANGYYPNLTDFSCSGTATGISIVSVGAAQGTNSGCVFLGKVLVFQLSPATTYNNYTLAGSQQQTGPNPCNSTEVTTGLACANADIIVSSPALPGAPNDDFVAEALENGLNPVAMYYNGSTGFKGNKTGAVGFVTNSQGAYSSSGVLSSGATQVNLYAVATTTLATFKPTSPNSMYNAVDSPASKLTSVNDVEICFASGTTNQSGLIEISNGSGQLQAAISKIYSDSTC